MRSYEGSYGYIHRQIGHDLAHHSSEVRGKTWHAVDISDSPMHVSWELDNVSLGLEMPLTQADAEVVFEPQMPWAEEHFQERVCGQPLNPPPSASKWLKPGAVDRHLKDFGGPEPQYSHTYPERLWPLGGIPGVAPFGIRFRYGDLNDVVNLLKREPFTRQAFLPIWFPEDTGAHHGERVPCTLGYHFMVREGRVSITYMIRSVDFIRHFHDDVYMAVRLAQWMAEQIKGECVCPNDTDGDEGCGQRYCSYCGIQPMMYVGSLTMHVMSMHAFEGDMNKLRSEYGAD